MSFAKATISDDEQLPSMPFTDDAQTHARSHSRNIVPADLPRGLLDSPPFHVPFLKHPAANHYGPSTYPPDDDSILTPVLNDLLPRHSPPVATPGQPLHHRPQDPNRWSSSYSASAPRSRSSSIGNSYHDVSPPPLSQKPSYDLGWQSVDEKDEIAISEEETDDEHTLDNLDDDSDPKEDPEPTSAVIVAEQGRGLIVDADRVPIFQLQIQPGTTHLLIGSSTTPNAVPAFLSSTLPQIAHSLLALDISANFLAALPPVLALCETLEELNVASNPLRVLPVFLADLINLRVLIADSTGIMTLPDTLVDLDKLHTISIRRNKLHALPSWLCLLPALQTLCVDGNPFQGPWKALVDPLLAKVPTTPVYPPSTPMMPLSAAIQSPQSSSPANENDGTDVEELSDQDAVPSFIAPPVDDDQTVTVERALLGRTQNSPYPLDQATQQTSKPLTRTRTTPNRAYYDQNRAKSSAGLPSDQVVHQANSGRPDEPYGGASEIRKMKSAGDLRRARAATTHNGSDMPPRPPISQYTTSLSSSNLLVAGGSGAPVPNPNLAASLDSPYPKRFTSLGPNSQLSSRPPLPTKRPQTAGGRPQLSQSVWEPSVYNGVTENGQLTRSSSYNPAASMVYPPKVEPLKMEDLRPPQKQNRGMKEKNTRWGFLKKMSMGKIKPDAPIPSPSVSPNASRIGRPVTTNGSPSRQFGSVSHIPQIDVRFSTTGALDLTSQSLNSTPLSPPSPILEKPSPPPPPSAAASNGLLSAPRTAKRRSFLPIDAPGQISLSIPENSKFVSGVVISHDGEEQPLNGTDSTRGSRAMPTLSVDVEQIRRKEEERARDAYMRALRSVMAYLKDMNDLSQAQQSNPLSMYGSSSDEVPHPRSRRPTMVDTRESSMGSSGGSTTDCSTQLRSAESIAGMRSGSSSQTLSVATTDSTGSQDERKFKDDRSKRAMVIREIVVTERTYVKGLNELVDIYIQPACATVNVLSGSKDSVVPASERRVVFNGIDSLFSFHNDSFLPALEGAAAPLMRPSAELLELDADGQLSLNVAKAVGNIFVKHAAFMKMYSSYINNFDSSLQRVKYWTSDKYASGNSSPGNALTPASSSAHLVGLGISMAMSTAPNALADSLPTSAGIPNLSTGQRKRIKSYLKRCRLNPRHTQLNLEGYLLLPVQRVPRYKLLLEELVRNTPPPIYEYLDDPLDRALSEISALASNMNEGKREAESRRKLVRWQSRIRGKFPSPLVQPHRKLIMDGPLLLTRVVRKAVVSFEAITAQGDSATVQVDCLAPELTPRPLIGILCNDLLVLCRDPSEGQDPSSPVDLWAVLRMQTLPQPASIVHGNALRLVDNKAILYFDAPSPSDALNWYRAINLHIPASKA